MTCNHSETKKYITKGNIVLTKNDRKKIKDGQCINFHFHALQFQHGRITFFVSFYGNYPKVNSEITQKYGKIGAVSPLPITLEQLERIERTDEFLSRIIPSDPPFEIRIITSDAYVKVMSEKKMSCLQEDDN